VKQFQKLWRNKWHYYD